MAKMNIFKRGRINKNTLQYITVLAIVILAAFLRFYDLGGESIWWDEGYSIRVASLSLADMFQSVISKDLNPPLYTLLLHYWILLVGNSEFAVRALSAVFGIAAVYVMYLLGNQLFRSEVGYFAALIMAVSQFLLVYSQEARVYSLLLLLTLLSNYFFVRFLERPDNKLYGAYVFSSVLLIYSHIFGALMVFIQLVFFIALKTAEKDNIVLRWKTWLISQLSILAFSIPWGILFVGKYKEAAGQAATDMWPIPKPDLVKVLDTFTVFSGNSFLLIILAALIVILILDYFEPSKPGHMVNDDPATGAMPYNFKLLLILLWLTIPVVFAAAASFVTTPIFLDKYLIEVVPAFLLLAAVGLSSIDQKAIKYAIIILVLAASLVEVANTYTVTNKEQWRDMTAVINEQAKPGDYVIFNIGSAMINCFDYYTTRKDLRRTGLYEDRVRIDTTTLNLITRALKGKSRVWLVLYMPNAELERSQAEIARTVSRDFDIQYQNLFYFIDLYCLERKSSQ